MESGIGDLTNVQAGQLVTVSMRQGVKPCAEVWKAVACMRIHKIKRLDSPAATPTDPPTWTSVILIQTTNQDTQTISLRILHFQSGTSATLRLSLESMTTMDKKSDASITKETCTRLLLNKTVSQSKEECLY